MLEEFRIAYARHREDDVTATPETAWSWLEEVWASSRAANDRVRWTYEPIDPWHLAFTPGVQTDRGRRRRRSRPKRRPSDARRSARGEGASPRAGRAPLGQALSPRAQS